MHWIVWALLAWLAVSAVAAVVFGLVIRARDRRETPPLIGSEDGPPPSARAEDKPA